MFRLLAAPALGALLVVACATAGQESASAARGQRLPAALPAGVDDDAAAPARDPDAPPWRYSIEELRSGEIDHVLHGVGPMWNAREVESYLAVVPETPPIVVRMGVNLMPSPRQSLEQRVGELRHFFRLHEPRLPLLSLTWRQTDRAGRTTSADRAVSGGRLDAALDLVVELVREAGRPVFLRIGTEANLPESGHEPAAFIEAYRHIVEHFRAAGVDNAIFMWNYKFQQGLQPPVTRWYPGDAWVDWWSIDLFLNDLTTPELRDKVVGFLADARARGKPVMIPECGPNGLDLDDPASWNRWFVPFFDLIRRYPIIRGFCYSNRDFEREHAGLRHWGDLRLQGKAIADRWREELRRERYLHGRPETVAERKQRALESRARGEDG